MSAPSFSAFFRLFLRVGLLGFGGPAGQIALMHRLVIEEKKWLSEEEYLRALNFCTLIPGPEAQQLAAYTGWRLFGLKGALTAGALFVLPGLVLILALAAIYAQWGTLPAAQGLFYGLKAAVVAIVLEALIKIGKRALKTPAAWAMAAASFLMMFALHLPFPLIVIGALALGFAATPLALFAAPKTLAGAPPPWPPLGVTLKRLAAGLALWFGPLALAAGLAGGVFTDLGVFFSKTAVATFGGAYAILSYAATQAQALGWATAGETIDALALSETTPGPLLLTLAFLGSLAGARLGGLGALAGGLLGGLVTAWATFAPSTLFVILGAPYVERLGRAPRLSSAMAAATAAAAGAVADLAARFGLHVVAPELRPDAAAILIAGLSALALIRFKAPMLAVLGAAALAGIIVFSSTG